MNDKQGMQDNLANWAAWLRQHKLVDVALMGLQIIEMWGFAGEQLIWALMPFVNRQNQTVLRDLIEHPESLQQLKLYLAEGGD